MNFSNDLLDLDYLIYSSHKSGTQTLNKTLNNSGFKCRHCHYLENIDIENGYFLDFLNSYREKNNRKLTVLTVFREPMERHVSSFFQGYGTRPIRLREVKDKSETIIYNYKMQQLQERYLSELEDNSVIGFKESIHELFEELHIDVNKLTYNEDDKYGVYETENIRLICLRFDVLYSNFEYLISEITKKKIDRCDQNISSLKWYGDIYAEFKKSLTIPQHIIAEVYGLKKDLVNIFYGDRYQSSLDQAFTKYSGQSPTD